MVVQITSQYLTYILSVFEPVCLSTHSGLPKTMNEKINEWLYKQPQVPGECLRPSWTKSSRQCQKWDVTAVSRSSTLGKNPHYKSLAGTMHTQNYIHVHCTRKSQTVILLWFTYNLKVATVCTGILLPLPPTHIASIVNKWHSTHCLHMLVII